MRDLIDSSTMKMVRDLADSPTMKVVRDLADSPTMKMMRNLADSPTMKMMRNLADSPTMKMMRDLADSPTMKVMRDLADSPTTKVMRDLADSPWTQSIENITAQHQRILKGLNLAGEFDGLAILTGRMQIPPALDSRVAVRVEALQTAIDQISTADDYNLIAVEKHFEELLDELMDLIEQAVEKIEIRTVIQFVGWVIPILLSFYLYEISSIQTKEQSEESRNRHNEIVDAVVKNAEEANERTDRLIYRLEDLENKIDELSESQNLFEGTFYIVVRPVPLNVERRLGGPVICWLLVGQEVELFERSGKWIRVIAYDFTTGRSQVGWVMKKYLRRLQ